MPLPVLLSIPHGGRRVPPELEGRTCLEPADILEDIDAFTEEIYDLGPAVAEVVSTETARPFVDVNRSPADTPDINPDGVVKSVTCKGRPIYHRGSEPDPQLIGELLPLYYEPYHQRILRALERRDIFLALDCHSMEAVGPLIAPDTGQRRPMVCLGDANGQSCARHLVETLAQCFVGAFSLTKEEVTINEPFAGGYITQTYGNNPIPWVQVEISRELYLRPPWFDHSTLSMDPARLARLKKMFETTISLLFSKYHK